MCNFCDRVEHFIPKSKNFTKSQKHEILVKGIIINDPDYLYTNISISIAVQKFVFKSKRFQFLTGLNTSFLNLKISLNAKSMKYL